MIAERIAEKFPENRWQRGYILGKIRLDPAYEAVFEALRNEPGPLWDGGCGLGLLGFFLHERGWKQQVIGTDLSVEKVEIGNRVAEVHYSGVHLSPGSIADPPEGFRGNVALLDVLHYLDYEGQRVLLERVIAMVPPGGICLVRFTAKDKSWRYKVTMLEEILIRGIGWIRGGRICFPRKEQVEAPFQAAGWETRMHPLWGRTPFNSYLLTARRPPRSHERGHT